LSVFNQKTREFEFRPGPVMANVVLVDEINRALPKTQSALLEAMAEGQVTVDGVTRELPRPFLLIATENPIEYEGTFPLPEAQLDRFLVRTALGYPDSDTEREIVQRQRGGHPLGQLRPVVTAEEVRAAQTAIERIYVDDLIETWVLDLVRSTRELDEASMGASVRGSLSFDRLLRAWALIQERDFVIPEDVEKLFMPVLAHRVVFSPRFLVRMRQVGREQALAEFADRCFELAPRPTASADDALAALRR
jgi:MoxR-like ATPase